MKCPVCGAADLVRDTRDLNCAYKGETIVIPAVTGEFCPACTEAVLDMTEAERCGAAIRAFDKQGNGAITNPAKVPDRNPESPSDVRAG